MGIVTQRDGIEPQSVLGVDMGIVGIVGTAPAADAGSFPLNTAVKILTNNTTLRTALGSTGTLPDALTGISAQLSASAATCVVVRVEDDADVDTVIANIIGSEANETGMWALLNAPEDLGLTPRLIIVPGYTSQTSQGVDAVVVSDGGSGYTTAPTVTASGGGSDPDKVLPTFTAVLGTGASADKVVSVTIDTAGEHLTAAPTLAFTGGAGTGAAATATISTLANAVCASIATVVSRLKAKFLPEGPNDSEAVFETWLETLPQSENYMHPLYQDALVTDSAGDVVTKPLSPYIIGLYVRRDAEFDGVPGHSAANQSINGLVGVTPKVKLDITSSSSLGMDLIEKHAGIVVRGENGVDGSLTDGGFTFWGTDTLSADTQWLFTNVVRMRDFIEINLIKSVRYYLGRYNITEQTVQAIINTMDSYLSQLRADRDILDFRIDFEADQNTPEELRLGFLTIGFRAEEPAPLRKITMKSRRYSDALTELVASISETLGNLQSA
jgi:phage tail sheath protein FI